MIFSTKRFQRVEFLLLQLTYLLGMNNLFIEDKETQLEIFENMIHEHEVCRLNKRKQTIYSSAGSSRKLFDNTK